MGKGSQQVAGWSTVLTPEGSPVPCCCGPSFIAAKTLTLRVTEANTHGLTVGQPKDSFKPDLSPGFLNPVKQPVVMWRLLTLMALIRSYLEGKYINTRVNRTPSSQKYIQWPKTRNRGQAAGGMKQSCTIWANWKFKLYFKISATKQVHC